MTERRANAKVYKDDEGMWRFRVQAANGEIVAIGESYARKADAQRGLRDAVAAFVEATTEQEPS
jgi:uncharacterized protein YegP (UPF0339 family)